MRNTSLRAIATVAVLLALGVAGCSESSTGVTSTGGGGTAGGGSPTTTLSEIRKTVGPDGTVTLGDLTATGFALSLPSDAYPAVADVIATVAPSAAAPVMTAATGVADGIQVDTGNVGRLESSATLTYRYDPATTPDPSLLALGYHDGSEWTYVFASSGDTAAGTVVFPLYHFSAYYPAQFKNELEAAKYYAGQMAAQKVLGDGGGDPKMASQMLADLLAAKLGLGEDEFSKRMFADIAADQEIVKVFDQYMKEGWTDTGYTYVVDFMCGKVAARLEEAKKGNLSTPEAALDNMWDILKVGNAGSKILGSLAEGDTDTAGKELFGLVTDYTGLAGKAIKYTLAGMQNALDVWRDGEVEKAFRVYTEGSSGTLFGYGAVDPGDFDAVWDNMKGASRQLCVERIRKENEARRLLGLSPLTAKEEEFYREKVKAELKSEFERRTALKDKIDAQKKNLELIFTELDAAKLFDSTNVWIRKIDPNETLESRLNRFNQLIQRIFRDLRIDSVYSGPQMTNDLNGRISAAAMAEMLRGYFSAGTQAEGEKFLQEYYAKFSLGRPTLSRGVVSGPVSKFEAAFFDALVLKTAGTGAGDPLQVAGEAQSPPVSCESRGGPPSRSDYSGGLTGTFDPVSGVLRGTYQYSVFEDQGAAAGCGLPHELAFGKVRFSFYVFEGTFEGRPDASGRCELVLTGTMRTIIYNFAVDKDYKLIYPTMIESDTTVDKQRVALFSVAWSK